jgi:hypothetical protein
VVEDPAAGPGAVAVVRPEAGRLAVPVCGNLVVRGAAEVAGERVQVAEAVVVELVMAVESVAAEAAGAEGPEPADELELQVLKARHLENGGRRRQCCTQAAPEQSRVYRE